MKTLMGLFIFWRTSSMFRNTRIILVYLLILFSGNADADLAIIAHPDYDGGELNEEFIRGLFLGDLKTYPSGHAALPANHAAGSPDRKAFFEYVLGMGESRHRRYWSRKISAGKKGAPVELNSYDEVLEWIARNPLGITYIDKSLADESVKVLHTVYVFDDM
jgi:ABC-type phosphate transport system substrate-binding protein